MYGSYVGASVLLFLDIVLALLSSNRFINKEILFEVKYWNNVIVSPTEKPVGAEFNQFNILTRHNHPLKLVLKMAPGHIPHTERAA